MTTRSTAGAAGLLVLEAALAVVGVLFHQGLTAEYGDITASTVEAWKSGFTAGTSAIALVLVGVVAVAAVAASPRLWMRLTAVALPVLMVLGMLAVTPLALGQKLEQYDDTPQCVSEEDMGPGPGTRAAQESQEAFESIEHVGHFGGGGGSGVGGCDRLFTLTADVDVLEHYRSVLPEAGWQVVEDQEGRLRAERGDMAFEVAVCGGRDGIVWAGAVGVRGVARCDRATDEVSIPGM